MRHLGPPILPTVSCSTWFQSNGVLQGDKLWPGATPNASLAALQRALHLTNVPAHKDYAWRSVRAGRATELAATPGVSITDIMEAGEWTSAAVLKYITPKDVDPVALVAQVLDASDDEDPS